MYRASEKATARRDTLGPGSSIPRNLVLLILYYLSSINLGITVRSNLTASQVCFTRFLCWELDRTSSARKVRHGAARAPGLAA